MPFYAWIQSTQHNIEVLFSLSYLFFSPAVWWSGVCLSGLEGWRNTMYFISSREYDSTYYITYRGQLGLSLFSLPLM